MSIELAKEVTQSLREGTKELKPGPYETPWTFAVKSSLIKLGKMKGYRVCASGFPDVAEGEWLYDVVWFLENEQELLAQIPLVCESEWGNSLNHVKIDFEKLLLANSELKIMVCQTGKESVESLIDYFVRAIQTFERPFYPEIYAIAIFNNDKFTFEFTYLDREGVELF